MNMTTIDIDNVITGYVTAMLWANASCNVVSCELALEGRECEHTLDAEVFYSLEDFSPEDRETMRNEIEVFIAAGPEDFAAYCERRGAEQFGHDVALTRNYHGVGFWDRGLGTLGDRLTERCHALGEASVLVGTDTVELGA